ncbi:MAG TPA: hypothetical protein VJN02_03945 [Gammaproteobacteria bacterium]|nr:hypothetical protein [Gammaproteobacteria bacterium]
MSGSRNDNPTKKVELKKVPNQPEASADKFPLAELPVNLLNGKTDTSLSRFLPLSAIKALTQVRNRHLFFGFAEGSLEADKQIKKFITHVVRGEKAESEAMLKEDPGLLLHKAKVVDEAGRTIYGTAYQIALGAKDVSPYPGQFEEMAEMLERYLLQLPNGEKERKKQYDEQFPEGFEKQEEARKQRDLDALQKLFKAIDKAKNDHELDDAIKVFKQYLEKENTREFKTGYHFNEDLFIKAAELYDHYNDKFGGYNSKKNNLVAVKGFGGIEGYFPANLAQAMCDGVGNVVEKKQQLTRSKLLNDKKTSFFDSNLGVSHFVYSYYSVGPRRGGVWRSGLDSQNERFKTYVEQKQQPYQTAKYRY